MQLETRGPEHVRDIIAAVEGQGFSVREQMAIL
jgi:hypothetical protein